uniref:Uncharacterized protein n=1 Tax=Kalanchoe fedtschenkoi TaxID=63787 RepID=A0A7N0T252_KALFE
MDGMKQIRSTPCSPHEIIFAPDFHQALYCHLLCGLIYREEIQVVSSGFAYSIVSGFQKLEQVWEELVNDIRLGVLSKRITDPSIRAAVSKILRPDPVSADLIYAKCKGLEKWRGVIPTLFPNVKYVLGIMTGSMEAYVEKLRAYAGHVPLVGGDYVASEGWIGINADPKARPESVAFSVVPNVGYFEFLPISDDIRDVHDTVGLTEVKLGVYRYKLGDVVKVVGFHNSTPKLQFVRRSGAILNVNIDKTTERDLQRSVELASKVLSDNGCELIEYSSQVDRSTDVGHYVIYWEIAGEPADDVLRECCNALDRGFVDIGYVNPRNSRDIGPLELRIVRRGTFANLLEHFMCRGGTAYQFKTPRCVSASNTSFLEILSDGVVKSYFSTAFG